MSNLTIYCDSAENTFRKVVNTYGKIKKFDNGGYRVGLYVEGEPPVKEQHLNRQCPDQFAGECFSVLKSVEYAVKVGAKNVVIRNDRIESFTATTKRGYKGSTYLWLAQKMANESGLTVEFDPCTSETNLADAVARDQDFFKKQEAAA